MNPNDPNPQKIQNPLEVMSPGERVICEIKRHPFGLIGVYLTTGLIIVALVAGAVFIPHYVTTMDAHDKLVLFICVLIFIVLASLYAYIASTIYNGNRWIVTSDSITQIDQIGLFRKQTSQLSLANLEDVTFDQNSMLQTMIGFGTLHVETAGSHSKFQFAWCPNPNEYAKMIIQAHEGFIQEHPDGEQNADVALTTRPDFQQQAQQPYYAPPQQQPPYPPYQQPGQSPIPQPAAPLPQYQIPGGGQPDEPPTDPTRSQ